MWSSVAIVAIAGICLAGAQMMLDYALQPENDGQDIDGSYKYMYDEYPFLRPCMGHRTKCITMIG